MTSCRMEIMLPYFSKQFEECYDEIKKFLELSGDIHDCDVFAAEMQMHLKEMREFNRAVAEKISTKKIRELLKDLKAKRAKMFEKLCGVLKRWQRESFREKLIRWMEMRRGRMSVGGKTA